MRDDCVFCDRIERGEFDREHSLVVAFEPLNPVTPGHMLVVPRAHVEDVAESASVAARTMAFASLLAKEVGDCNVITSRGEAATQTIRHLHLHVVPRRRGDGLALPWTTSRLTNA